MAQDTSALASPESMTGLRACVHCGICLPHCPTYQVLGEEMDSPRGRLYLMRAVAEGRLEKTETYTRHLDLCLGCRACETACPAGVPFGALLESARVDIEQDGRPLPRRLFGRLLFATLPYPDRMASLLGVAALWRRSGLQRLVRSTGLLARFPRLAAMDSLLGDVAVAPSLPEFIPARGRVRGRVGVLTGCVQRHVYPEVNRDTALLLSLAGYDVVIPRAQGCCGALELHAGRLEALRRRARALATVFPTGLDWIVSNAAGCGSAMREYHHWVPDPAVERIAQHTRDVSELLADADLPLSRLERTVAYHDACHLSHGQNVRGAPRALLRRIPGLTLVELQGGELCCGSAGIYNILEPAMADELLALKIDRIIESGARTLVAGNPGCLMQIAKGCRARGLDIDVLHPITLVAQAAGLHP